MLRDGNGADRYVMAPNGEIETPRIRDQLRDELRKFDVRMGILSPANLSDDGRGRHEYVGERFPPPSRRVRPIPRR